MAWRHLFEVDARACACFVASNEYRKFEQLATNKTIANENSVESYLAQIPDKDRREDCTALRALMARETKIEAKMWGDAIVGFGSYHYKYESGREGDAPLAAFSCRANAISLYLFLSTSERVGLLPKLGNHKAGKSCIYIRSLTDVDAEVLAKLVGCSVKNSKAKHRAP